MFFLQLEETYSPIPGYRRVRIDSFAAGSLIVLHTVFFEFDSPITVDDLDDYVNVNINNNGLLGKSTLRVFLTPTTQIPGRVNFKVKFSSKISVYLISFRARLTYTAFIIYRIICSFYFFILRSRSRSSMDFVGGMGKLYGNVW